MISTGEKGKARMSEKVWELADLMASAGRVVVFSGAGMSTESGIPDYRSPGGLWQRHQPPVYQEFLASDEARVRYWHFYREMYPAFAEAAPNQGHLALGRFYRAGKLRAVVTQNIDGLHQAGGVDPNDVVELHGSAGETECLDCRQHREPTAGVLERFAARGEAPLCPLCHGPLKPRTISFGQSLDQQDLERAAQLCGEADLLLVVGSSLVVTPAAELPRLTLAQSGRLAILNREPTPLDDRAALVLRQPAAPTLARAAELVLGN
jgi:NAD-dependent deacetylase